MLQLVLRLILPVCALGVVDVTHWTRSSRCGFLSKINLHKTGVLTSLLPIQLKVEYDTALFIRHCGMQMCIASRQDKLKALLVPPSNSDVGSVKTTRANYKEDVTKRRMKRFTKKRKCFGTGASLYVAESKDTIKSLMKLKINCNALSTFLIKNSLQNSNHSYVIILDDGHPGVQRDLKLNCTGSPLSSTKRFRGAPRDDETNKQNVVYRTCPGNGKKRVYGPIHWKMSGETKLNKTRTNNLHDIAGDPTKRLPDEPLIGISKSNSSAKGRSNRKDDIPDIDVGLLEYKGNRRQTGRISRSTTSAAPIWNTQVTESAFIPRNKTGRHNDQRRRLSTGETKLNNNFENRRIKNVTNSSRVGSEKTGEQITYKDTTERNTSEEDLDCSLFTFSELSKPSIDMSHLAGEVCNQGVARCTKTMRENGYCTLFGFVQMNNTFHPFVYDSKYTVFRNIKVKNVLLMEPDSLHCIVYWTEYSTKRVVSLRSLDFKTINGFNIQLPGFPQKLFLDRYKDVMYMHIRKGWYDVFYELNLSWRKIRYIDKFYNPKEIKVVLIGDIQEAKLYYAVHYQRPELYSIKLNTYKIKSSFEMYLTLKPGMVPALIYDQILYYHQKTNEVFLDFLKEDRSEKITACPSNYNVAIAFFWNRTLCAQCEMNGYVRLIACFDKYLCYDRGMTVPFRNHRTIMALG